MIWTITNGVDNPIPSAKAGEFWVRYDNGDMEILSLYDSEYWTWDHDEDYGCESLQITHYRMDSDVSTI